MWPPLGWNHPGIGGNYAVNAKIPSARVGYSLQGYSMGGALQSPSYVALKRRVQSSMLSRVFSVVCTQSPRATTGMWLAGMGS